MLGWLLVSGLVIIWAIFLYPFLRRRRSPVTTVEEFEQKMDFLAETNVAHRGRWVIAPRKGERFLGERGRSRSRVRERRRQVFTILVEMTGLALLIGLVPMFHRILLGAAILGGLLVVYAMLLVRIRSIEAHRAQLRRARRVGARQAPAPAYAYASEPAWMTAGPNGNGNGNANGNGHRTVRASRTRAEADADGWGRPVARAQVRDRGDDQVIYVDEDVHIVVHRSDELNLLGLRAAMAR
jgi:hypothetical protein